MPIQPQNAARLVQLLVWTGGVATTIAGSWVANKIRLYHDDRKSHHQELRENVLLPLHDLLAKNQALFEHKAPVIVEKWARLRTRDARPDQDDVVYGPVLQSENPWPDVIASMDRALFEDAASVHYKNVMTEIRGLAVSWRTYAESCLTWVSEIGVQVLDVSKMNPYQPPYNAPYVNHLRLAVWIYRRLFHLPTDVLHQSNQGQYWSIEGAPTVPSVSGVSTLANEEQNTMLIQAIETISLANSERATVLQRESKVIASRADALRSKLEYEMAKKRLRNRCVLVKFF